MPLLPALALLSARPLLAASAGSVRPAWGRLAATVYVLWLALTIAAGVGILAASIVFFDASWLGPVSVALPLTIAIPRDNESLISSDSLPCVRLNGSTSQVSVPSLAPPTP